MWMVTREFVFAIVVPPLWVNAFTLLLLGALFNDSDLRIQLRLERWQLGARRFGIPARSPPNETELSHRWRRRAFASVFYFLISPL
jgi:hypothetical protein